MSTTTIKRVQRATSKGQITLPMQWRSNFDTDQFVLKSEGNKLVISPAYIEENNDADWVSVWNAEHDNAGKAMPAKEMLTIMNKIKKERSW